MTPKDLSTILRRARIASGMDQQELAAAADVHRNTISSIECGRHLDAFATLNSIAVALDLEFKLVKKEKE